MKNLDTGEERLTDGFRADVIYIYIYVLNILYYHIYIYDIDHIYI